MKKAIALILSALILFTTAACGAQSGDKTETAAPTVLLLQEQGKLSVSDTLDKYFPEYADGGKTSMHNLLSMRAGIPELTDDNTDGVKNNATKEGNVAFIKKWVFSQPLAPESAKAVEYRNINYFMLSQVVEQVSGKKYADFLRESFFTPLGMTHTGTIGDYAAFDYINQDKGFTLFVVSNTVYPPSMTGFADDLLVDLPD